MTSAHDRARVRCAIFSPRTIGLRSSAYNGPGYRKNRYDEKLQSAYERGSASLG
jgi:hypothetical protein